jgi:hypothetical protein
MHWALPLHRGTILCHVITPPIPSCLRSIKLVLEGEIPAVWSPLLMLNYLENEF